MKPVTNYIDTPPTTIHGGTPALDLWLGRTVSAMYSVGLNQREQITGTLRRHADKRRGNNYFVIHGNDGEWVNIIVSDGVVLEPDPTVALGKICPCCHKLRPFDDVQWRVNPYQSEINDDDSEQEMCSECEDDYRGDI